MNYDEKYALFLGMLSGDGCLSIKYNGEGYRNYPIEFCNTKKSMVLKFEKLFFDLFGIHGNIHSRKRPNRKEIWHFLKCSHKIVDELKEIGFPEGVKRDVLRIVKKVKNGTKKEKLLFIYGVIITDGSLNHKRILFHSGSKLFMEDMSKLISEFIGKEKHIKKYVQREIYRSYQLCLNKGEMRVLLSQMPRWDNGTPVVLRVVKNKPS